VIKGFEASQRRNVRASTTPAPANQPPEHPTRTCKHWNLTYCCALRGHHLAGKKRSPSDTVIERYRQNAISYNARFRPRPQHSITTHAITSTIASKVCATKHRPPSQSGSPKLFCCRSPDPVLPVCASRPAKKHGRLFCRGVAAKRHHSTSSSKGARARYFPRYSPAKTCEQTCVFV